MFPIWDNLESTTKCKLNLKSSSKLVLAIIDRSRSSPKLPYNFQRIISTSQHVDPPPPHRPVPSRWTILLLVVVFTDVCAYVISDACVVLYFMSLLHRSSFVSLQVALRLCLCLWTFVDRGGSLVELHCLGSGMCFELLESGSLRIAWIIV